MTDPATSTIAELQRLNRRHDVERRELHERQYDEVRALFARVLLTSEPEPGRPSGVPDDLLRPNEAQKEFNISKRSLHRRGTQYPLSKGGFCFDADGKRMYSKALGHAHFRLHPLRRQHKKVKPTSK